MAVDDASRLAYVEVLPDEKRQSVTGFLVRALRWFKSLGIRVERVMTDNGSGYVSRLFRKACRMLRLRHLRTRPYTPKTNGKAERFIQTLLREWAYALPYRSSDTRAADLPRGCATTTSSDPMLVSPPVTNRLAPGSRLGALLEARIFLPFGLTTWHCRAQRSAVPVTRPGRDDRSLERSTAPNPSHPWR